jgi:hypothetical protein
MPKKEVERNFLVIILLEDCLDFLLAEGDQIGEIMRILASVPSEYLAQALTWSEVNLPSQYQSIAKEYKEHGEKYGVQWAMAFAQACHETGVFGFGGAVKPEQNNFAGIAATGNGVPGESFDTISEGVLAQIQHLACYAGKDIPDNELVADRTKEVKSYILGKSESWEGLAGTWAADPDYFEGLLYHYQRIFQPREQNPGWYRLVEEDSKKFFVAMSGENPIFKYPVKDHSILALKDASQELIEAFPSAQNVHSDKAMDVYEIPTYEPITVPPPVDRHPVNGLPTSEPPYFWRQSPNKSTRRDQIEYIILHNTAGSFWGSVSWLCNPASRASAHLVIPRDGGKFAALVSEKEAAWHAGSRKWNHCSIGIEIECAENQRGMTEVQEKLLVQQLNHLLIKHNLTPDKIDIHRRVKRNPLSSQPTSSGQPITSCPILIWKTDHDFFDWRKKWYGV